MSSVLWRCWLGDRKGIRPVKTEWWGAGVVMCLERGADFHMAQLMSLPLTVSCFSKIQIGFTFLVPAHLGSPGKRAVKRVCVCVFVQMTVKCCITSSTSMVHLHLTILRHIQTQTTAVSLLQLITGKWYDVTTNIVLSVSPTMTRCQVLCKLWQPIYISLCVHTFTSVSCKLTSLDLSVCQTYNIQHGPIKAVPHFVISCLLKKRLTHSAENMSF